MIEVLKLLFGLALLVYASSKTIEATKHVGNTFRIPPIIMGTVILAIGTSLPETTNSVTASILGHGELVVGDVIGSNLIEITFVLGLIAILHPLYAKRKDVLLIGGSAIIASILAVVIAQKGYINQGDAVILLIALVILLYINQRFAKKQFEVQTVKDGPKYIVLLIIALIGVIAGANITITSAIELSITFGIPEFLIAFLIIGPGGSLPELAVSLAALKKKEHELSIGNLLGSNITDSTLALGLGPLIAPITFDGALVSSSGWYMIFASIIVVGLFAYRQKADRKSGFAYMAIYLLFVLLALLGAYQLH